MQLKLFVWEDVLVDWTAGVMFALAHDVEEARELIVKNDPRVYPDDLSKVPQVYDSPIGFAVFGGS